VLRADQIREADERPLEGVGIRRGQGLGDSLHSEEVEGSRSMAPVWLVCKKPWFVLVQIKILSNNQVTVRSNYTHL
jgi:hypothetical protein